MISDAGHCNLWHAGNIGQCAVSTLIESQRSQLQTAFTGPALTRSRTTPSSARTFHHRRVTAVLRPANAFSFLPQLSAVRSPTAETHSKFSIPPAVVLKLATNRRSVCLERQENRSQLTHGDKSVRWYCMVGSTGTKFSRPSRR